MRLIKALPFILLMYVSSCKKDSTETLTPIQQQQNSLTGTTDKPYKWKISSLSIGNVPQLCLSAKWFIQSNTASLVPMQIQTA
jgi:hypothetical protein